jgi:hypothetical protein
MPTTFGFTKFSAPTEFKFKFLTDKTEKNLKYLTAKLENPEDLANFRDLINSVSDMTDVNAELKDVTGTDGDLYKTCILSSQSDEITFQILKKSNVAAFSFLLFQPENFNANQIELNENTVYECAISNGHEGLKANIRSLQGSSVVFDPTPQMPVSPNSASKSSFFSTPTASSVSSMSSNDNKSTFQPR